MYNINDIMEIAKYLKVDFNKFSPFDLLEGINVELEHGTINSKTNITNDDLLLTTKIALAHLNEFPNYYNKEYGIKAFENYLKTK